MYSLLEIIILQRNSNAPFFPRNSNQIDGDWKHDRFEGRQAGVKPIQNNNVKSMFLFTSYP